MDRLPLILIVDDVPTNVKLIELILQQVGLYETASAKSGKEALTFVAEHMPDLILLDVVMPGIDGFEVCRHVKSKEATNDIKVIMVTGKNYAESKERGTAAGMDGFLFKPYDTDALLSQVANVLHVQALQRELTTKDEELQDLYRQVQRQEQLAVIGFLAAGVSHEFNNVMTSLYGFAQLAKKDPKYKDTLIDATLHDVKRAMLITGNLQSFANRRLDVRKESNLMTLMDDILVLVQREIEQHRIELITDYTDISQTLVNRGEIQQVFLHLLINAVQSMMHGGTISVKMQEKDKIITVSIQDTGTGISPDKQKTIFEPFYTTKGTVGHVAQSGTGLGLSVARNIISSHKGTIHVDSTFGEGSTFVITLPVRLDRRKKSTSTDLVDRRSESAIIRRHKILVVDIEESVHNQLKEILTVHKVRCVHGIHEAMKLIEKEMFDFVFTDVKLAENEQGLELFEKIGKLDVDYQPDVIFMTREATTEKLRGYYDRAYAHIPKPVERSLVLGLLN